jgi:hypothetical protein
MMLLLNLRVLRVNSENVFLRAYWRESAYGRHAEHHRECAQCARRVAEPRIGIGGAGQRKATDDPIEQAQLVAGINNALLEIIVHEQSPEVLSSPPSAIASQLQSFLAEHAHAEDKPVARELLGGAEEVKFDSNDWLGWAKSFFSWAGGLKTQSGSAPLTTPVPPAH